MDVFDLRNNVVGDYGTYVRSFLTIKDERIRRLVQEEMEGGFLWPDPLIQLNPSFEAGRRKPRDLQDRWDGYDGCLDPLATDGPLLDWLRSEAFGDLARWGDLDPALIRAKGMMDWEE